MTFLTPLFLLGGLAIAGPIILHLIRRTTKEHTPFSSLMFLRPTPPRVTRRSRLENLWLLLLRCLVITLLAFGFARPFFQQTAATPPAAPTKKRTILLVDQSASMRRGDLWKEARAKAEERLRKATPEDDFALITYARAIAPLVTFEQWRQTAVEDRVPLALQKFDAITPGWGGTNLGPALLRAAELLDAGREAASSSEVVVISDLQEGSKLDDLQGFSWPKGVRVVLDPVHAEPRENASAQWLAESGETGAAESGLRLRLQNSVGAKHEQFRLQWQPGTTSSTEAYVPAGQMRTTRPPMPPPGADRLVLSGDAEVFDNTLYVLPPVPAQVPVLFLGNDAPEDSQGALYFLRRAFPPTRAQTIEVVARRAGLPPAAFELQRAQLLILGEGLVDSSVAAAREFANSGKIVLYPLTTAEAAPAVAKLLDVPRVTLKEARGRDYALLAQIDFSHPLFAPFADPRYSDFTKIHFWKHRQLDLAALPQAKVLARFDDQSPALLQVPVGKGSVVVLTSSWRTPDSQFALSSKFVPWLSSLLEQSSRIPPRRAQYFVGDPVPLPPGTQPYRVRTPQGKEIETPAGGTFTATDEPGIYTVTPGGPRFAVNLAPEESRLEPLEPARLAALGVPLESTADAEAAKTPPDPALALAAELESRQKLWRWLLVGAILFLFVETLIAGRLTRAPVSHA